MHYLFLAEGFEETEALCPLDLMRRAGLNVTTIGIGGRTVRGAHGITVLADAPDSDFDKLCANDPPESVVLPGGMPGTKHLGESAVVARALALADRSGAYLCAICAAPSVLGQQGYLKGRKATCFPGFENQLNCGEILADKVVVDGKVITAAGMGVALQFGLAIVAAFRGEFTANRIHKDIQAESNVRS